MTDPADSIKLSVVPVWFKVCEGPCSALCCVPQGLLVGISGYSKQTAVQAPLCTLRLSAETGEVLATHRDVGAGAVRQIAQTSSGMGFMVATSAAPTKEVSLELKAMLDSKMSIDSPIFVAEGGYRGTRSGYLFRHGKHGLGYYRADKLVETEALHHSHVKDQPLRASETLQQDEQPACNSPAESSAQSAHGQHIRHQPGHERSRSPVSLQPEQDMASEQIRCHQGAEGLADVVRPMECKRGGSGAAARSETKDAAAAPESASDARQSSAEQISGVERAFDNPDVWDRK
ncbi:hypothetical protein WJX74_005596 [Apatococcus lobatus]|uniref:Uncharacterized protein n=1 Tax=Apatococcus lobatus TaxID=904363 RepID=A0AAW1RVL7_9CHLO